MSSLKYVIKMFNQYYLRDCGDFFEEIYDLEQATIFSSKKKAIACVLDSTYSSNSEVFLLDDILPEFLLWKKSGMVRRNLPKINRLVSRPYNGEGMDEVLKFTSYMFMNENKVDYDDYCTWPKLREVTKFIFDKECHSIDGKREITFSIAVSQDDDDYRLLEDEIKLTIPYITYRVDGNPHISIFDHTLSEFGSYYLIYNEIDNSHTITTGAGSILFSGTFEEVFIHIKNHYYYS